MRILTVLFTLVTNVLLAQTDFMKSCDFGEVYNVNGSTRLSKMLWKDISGYYMLRNSKNGTKESRIEHYSKDLGLIQSTKIKTKGKKPNTVIAIGGKIYQFSTRQGYNENSKNVNILTARIIDKNSLKPVGKEIELVRSIGQYEGVFNSSPFEILASPNGTKLMIHTKYAKVHGQSYKMDLHVFSDKLELLFRKNFDYTENGWFIHQLMVDDLGNVYLGYLNCLSSSFSVKECESYLWTYQLSKDKENTTLLDKNAFSGLKVFPYKDNGICIIGLDSNKVEVIIRTIKEEAKELVSQDLILDLPSPDKIMNTAKFDIIFNDNDEFFMVMEDLEIDFNSDVYHSFTNEIVSCSVKYRYGNIHILKASLSGEVLWEKQIERKGITASMYNGPYYSFSCVPTENGLSILYNDNSKNENRGELDKLKPFRMNRYLMFVKVDVDDMGQMTRNTKNFDNSSLKLFDISSNPGFFEAGLLLLKGPWKEQLFKL